jgi:hypothetical protein
MGIGKTEKQEPPSGLSEFNDKADLIPGNADSGATTAGNPTISGFNNNPPDFTGMVVNDNVDPAASHASFNDRPTEIA